MSEPKGFDFSPMVVGAGRRRNDASWRVVLRCGVDRCPHVVTVSLQGFRAMHDLGSMNRVLAESHSGWSANLSQVVRTLGKPETGIVFLCANHGPGAVLPHSGGVRSL